MSTCMVIKNTSFTKYRNCLKDIKCKNVIIYHQYSVCIFSPNINERIRNEINITKIFAVLII